jgi:hypothetical protein
MATIDELSAALVKADAAGNAADAKTFADEIRRMRATESEGMPAPRGFFDRLGASAASLADTALGIVPQAIAETGYAGVRAMEGVGLAKPGQAQRGKEAFLKEYSQPVGKTFGVTNTPEYQNEASQRLMQFVGEYAGKGANWLAEQTGLPKADIENMMFSASFAAPAVAGKVKTGVNAVAPVVKKAAGQLAETAPAQAVIKPLQERAARIQEENVARSFDNAAQIDAANLAAKYNVVLNPAISNPTKTNRIKSTVAGATNLNENLSKINEVKFTNLVKEDIGLPRNTVLNAKAFEEAINKQSAPYNAVRSIPQLVPDNAVIAEIENLRINRPAIGGEASAAAVNGLVDEALAKVAEGRSGAEIITDIRKLRKDANSVYSTQQKSGVPDPTLIAKADANIGVANALENLIETNVNDPKVLGDLRAARANMARIYDYERATNLATNRIDPQILAKMLEDGKPMSGLAADIAKIAAVFPDIAQSGKTGMPMWAPERLTRSGAAGTIGYALGSAAGMPLLGAVVGAGAGNLLSGFAGKRMATPAYQLANAIPQDFRPPVNNLRPAPPSTTTNLPVPYDYRNALVTPDQIPNWVFGQNDNATITSFGTTPPAKGTRYSRTGPEPIYTQALEAPGPESTLGTVAQQRAYEYQRQKAGTEAANTQQAAQEAANRVPARNESLFELDPITGKLRSVSQGMKGATPDVLESTGHSLAAAAQKVASGQRFAMSAEEKIAWDKTKTDLTVLDSGLAKLSDKAIAEKAMDRAWAEEAIVKARQKIAAFDEIAKRSKDAQQIQRANAERERLMDALELLEPQLSRPRATSVGEQGPKTREAIRNRLAPKNKNMLGD